MNIARLYAKIRLSYSDSNEEKEFDNVRLPLLKDFLKFLILCMICLMIPLSVHFFLNHLDSQGYWAIGAVILAVLIFLTRNVQGRWTEYVVVGFMIFIVVSVIKNLELFLLSLKSCEAFYGGYTFALIHRLLGYKVAKIYSMVIFHATSLTLRLVFLYDHRLSVSLMVTAVEVVTVCLCYSSEKGERKLFDALYKSKSQLLKFKDFLTEHLPSHMVILAHDYSHSLFMNKSFKRAFNCDDIHQVKYSLNTLVIDQDTLSKNRRFDSFGKRRIITLSQMMKEISLNRGTMLKDAETLVFQVYEDENFGQDFSPLNANQNTSGDKILPQFDGASSSSADIENGERLVKRKKGALFEVGSSAVPSRRGSQHFTESPMHNNIKVKTSFDEKREEMKRVFEVKIFSLIWDQDEAIALVLDDITKQKTITELKVADKNKDLVIAMVSHELRTPLNGMLGLLNIAKTMIPDQEVNSYLDACKNSGTFLLNLVNSILDMSQIQNKKLKLVYTKVNVQDLLVEIKSLFESFCLTKNLYLNLELAPNVPKVILTDRNRLSQVLINLLGNAFKFTFEGGITIKVERDSTPTSVKFIIQDTGVGIKKEDQGKLFKLFGRLDQKDKNINTNGVGLGLTISNLIAILLSPTGNDGIQLQSEVGKGSSFSFTIEASACDSLTQSEKGSSNENSHNPDSMSNLNCEEVYEFEKKEIRSIRNNVRGMITTETEETNKKEFLLLMTEPDSAALKIKNRQKSKPATTISSSTHDWKYEKKATSLRDVEEEEPDQQQQKSTPYCLVVDDNPFNLMVARHIMQGKGFDVKTALNGKDAIDAVVKHEETGETFQIILMDCQMPVMDGYESSKIINRMMKEKKIKGGPIFALTANNRDEEHERRCTVAGMSGNISKPLQADELDQIFKKLKRKRF